MEKNRNIKRTALGIISIIIIVFEEAGIPAAIIGKAVAGNDKVIIREGERFYLEPPKSDELYKVE